jgi:DNA-binding MarR family transcriptional regulator
MQHADAQILAFGLLAASRALVDRVSAGMAARGFGDLRPAHGFAFSRLAAGGATITELAEHLDVTRQAAAQLADELAARGYIERRPHPDDARARLLVLTDRGRAATAAAEEAITDAARDWAQRLGEPRLRALGRDLAWIAPDGPVRPVW